MLYCPEVTLSLVRVLQKLSACRTDHTPDIYVAFTVRNPETYQLFTTELGEPLACRPPNCPFVAQER